MTSTAAAMSPEPSTSTVHPSIQVDLEKCEPKIPALSNLGKDPYNLLYGLKSPDQLDGFKHGRLDRRGKKIQKYHRQQNNVRQLYGSLSSYQYTFYSLSKTFSSPWMTT